jgi:hypothetical protein
MRARESRLFRGGSVWVSLCPLEQLDGSCLSFKSRSLAFYKSGIPQLYDRAVACGKVLLLACGKCFAESVHISELAG